MTVHLFFGSANRYANFWSVGAMWDMKKEGFLKNVTWLDELKLKASYGTTGNSGIDNYLSLGLVSTGTSYNGNGSWSINNPSNKNLTWETVENMTLGLNLDCSILQQRKLMLTERPQKIC